MCVCVCVRGYIRDGGKKDLFYERRKKRQERETYVGYVLVFTSMAYKLDTWILMFVACIA